MSSRTRLTRAYQNAKVIPFDACSKFVLFRDCRRGDNSFADDFANNRNIYYHALQQYYKEGYTYFELGDGEDGCCVHPRSVTALEIENGSIILSKW